ncbi:MAG: histidine kinase [Paucimonas sp.]|nr:histidine kinase [Paucimonas sp.]
MNEKGGNESAAIADILDSLGSTESGLLARLEFLEFSKDDAQLLEKLHEQLNGYWDEFSERFYQHLSAYPPLRNFLDDRSIGKLKKSQAAYFSDLMSGHYDEAYVRNRIAVGLVHQRIGLSPEWYLGAYCKYLVDLCPALWKITGGDYAEFEKALRASRKIIFFDIGIALDTYFFAGRKALIEQKRFEEELRYQTTHDRLTGLFNRTSFIHHLDGAIREAATTGKNVSLVIVRLEDFASINASIGHFNGDQMLLQIARRLTDAAGDGGILGRCDSLEFAVAALTDASNPEDRALGRNLSAALADPYPIGGADLAIKCIHGGAVYPRDAGDASTLLRHAAIALKHAEQQGSETCLYFSDEMRHRVKLEQDLYLALQKNQLRIEYQPIIDLKTGNLAGVEALIRWEHHELGLLLPHEFIPLAEDTQLIDMIGNWVIECACREASAWLNGSLPGVRLAINVSPKQLDNAHFAEHVENVLSSTGFPAASLSLEITENVALKYTSQSIAALHRLKRHGVTFSIDDFSTGYSSLAHIKELPVDGVKIDLRSVGDIVGSAGDAAIVKAVISMAHSLGVRASAVGIETEEQCIFLREHMCDEIQGFFYCRPLPAAEVAAFLAEGKRIPSHLLRLQKPQRTLLLVDDEANIVAALKRLFRQDGYRILTANSGQEGLQVLEKEKVDVIISDQRMPGMMGVEFLRLAKSICPETVRIVLSGYTELQSVTDAVNEGAIYKFLTKPWEDQLLREHIAEAFRHKEMADENQRLGLEIRTANQQLASANRKMEQLLLEKQDQITRNEVSLDIVHEILQYISIPLLGTDENNTIVFANQAAESSFRSLGPLLAGDACLLFPDISISYDMDGGGAERQKQQVDIDGKRFNVSVRPMGNSSQAHGKLISFDLCGEAA